MERQLDLPLTSAEERVAAMRVYLEPIELASRLVSALCLIAARGDSIRVGNQPAVSVQISKAAAAKWGKAYGLRDSSGNTFLAAVLELEELRLVGVLRTTRPWTYVISLPALARLEPPADDPLAALPVFFETDRGADRSASVNAGQPPRVREDLETLNPCNPCSVSRTTKPAGLADRLRRPWHKTEGLTGDDLAQAVKAGDMEPLRRLWSEGLHLEWLHDSEDERLRFLTICHHCATVAGLGNRMAALVARVKQDPLNVARVRHASEDWAAAIIRKRHERGTKERAVPGAT